MTFPLDDIVLGPATFGRLHRLDLVVGHTGEEPGFDRRYAIATAIWQRTHPGSYGFRIYDALSEDSKGGVMLNVPYLEASGGINPLSPAWAPERFAWIRELLAKAGPCPVRGCGGPYANPTMHAGQVSFTGRTDQLAARAPANYLSDARRLLAWYDTEHPRRGPAPLVVVMHGHLQTNRSDWGTWMQSRLAPDGVWRPQPTTEEDSMLATYRPRVWRVTDPKGAELRDTPDSRPLAARITAGAPFLVVGDDFDQAPRWVIAVVPGDPPGLYYVPRSQATPINGAGPDVELHDAIATVVNRRIDGEPLLGAGGTAGVPKADLDAALAQIGALTERIQIKDRHNASYPKG